ncbi:MAG: DUF5916 domain-containing protein [Acidobacteria bacterium]|nr:DUF5916 domain-containing protein [Acidobacteriota bacterium]
MVGIFIDTFNDQNRAFAFFINPLGIQSEEIISDGGITEDGSWDAIWSAMGHIDDKGYEAELAIPFHALQFPRNVSEQTWGFILLRIYPRSQKHQITNFKHDRSNPCLLCQMPKLTGIKNVSPSHNIELDPTITTFRTDTRDAFPNGPLIKKAAKIDAGISATWGFTSNLTLSATVNPDFSQVEADIVQLDINTQFTLHYQEKRPFFLEGIDFFSTVIDAVYTRNLVDPSWGVKLSGKEGKNALGVFLCRDNITNLLFPGTESSEYTTLNQGSTASVIRYRRDIGNSSTLGFLFTGREGKDYYNRLAGFDGLLRIGGSDTIRFQGLASSTSYPTVSALEFMQKKSLMTGYGVNLIYEHNARTYGYNFKYINFSPDFRADMGFIPQVNYWKVNAGGQYIFWGEKKSFFSNFYIGSDLSQTKEYGGRLLERKIEAWTTCEMPLQSYLKLNIGKEKRTYNFVDFNQDFFIVDFGIRPSGDLSLGCLGSIRDQIDYTHTRPGKYFYLEPWLDCKLGKHLQGSFTYTYSYLDTGASRLFHTHVFVGKLVFHLNNRIFLRGIIQYTDISRNTRIYRDPVEPENRNAFMQFLFSYKINPRTVLFLGYSDNYLGFLDVPLKQVDRTFFLKIGYALTI